MDGAGSTYVTGYTSSFDFPTSPDAFRTSQPGGDDVFVTKIDANGTELVYSTFLGGTNNDWGQAIAVDVTTTGDTPEAHPMAVSLGKGPAIKIKDRGMLAHIGVKNWMIATAERLGLPYQLEVLERGTTDGTAIQLSRAGVATGVMSIPCRYVHSPSEMVDYGDVQNAVKLLLGLISGPINLDDTPAFLVKRPHAV